MDNVGILFFLFAIVLIFISGLAVAIGYFWASSATKSALLKQVKEQGNEAVKQAQEQLKSWKEQELISIRQQMLEGARGEAIKEAQVQLANWQEKELENIRKNQLELAQGEALLHLDQWKADEERNIRREAIHRSQAVTVGKVTEHFIPYLPDFIYNPKDARFLGSPIDFVVFDGLNNGDVKEIVFIEVKTGASTLSTRERRIRDAVQAGKVRWLELRPQIESLRNNIQAKDEVLPTNEVQNQTVVIEQESIDKNLKNIVASLHRIQTEGKDIYENYAIFTADPLKNYYIQFAVKLNESSLYAEAVSNTFIDEEFKMSPEQISQILTIGWKIPDPEGNFCLNWIATSDEERLLIARDVIRTFYYAYGVSYHRPLDIKIEINH